MVGALGLFAMSCSDDDNEVIAPVTPEDEFDARLNNNAADSLTATVFVTDVTDGEINVQLKFQSSGMDRVYITQNVQGQGDEKVDAEETFGVQAKGDGSIDLSGDDRESFNFEFTFNTTGLPTEGTIVYNFWTTTGKGDFRDETKRLGVGPAVLTINLGGNNPASLVKEYSTTILAAPLADGSSETFVSLIDGELYRIDEGEEFSAFWDFGYYYGASGVSAGQQASLASTSVYEESFGFVDVDGIAGTTELNEAFFALSDLTGADFDGVEVAADLSAIETPSNQVVNNLEAGDIIEFVDNYGKKGLIRVIRVVGTFNSTDFIEIDIKVQP